MTNFTHLIIQIGFQAKLLYYFLLNRNYLCRLQEQSLNLQPLSLFSHLTKVISVRSRSPYPYIFTVFEFFFFMETIYSLWESFVSFLLFYYSCCQLNVSMQFFAYLECPHIIQCSCWFSMMIKHSSLHRSLLQFQEWYFHLSICLHI